MQPEAPPTHLIQSLEALILRTIAEKCALSPGSTDRNLSINELGLDSLESFQIIDTINRALRLNLSNVLLFQGHSVASLSTHVAEVYSRKVGQLNDDVHFDVPLLKTDSPVEGKSLPPPQYIDDLETLSTSKSSKTLFCVHPLDGSALSYRYLAGELSPYVTVYGLQCRTRLASLSPPTDMTLLVEAYLTQMKSVQSEGPYYIYGASSGGIIALEIARRLKSQGSEIGALVFGDTHKPTGSYPSRHDWVVFAEVYCSWKVIEYLMAHLKKSTSPFWKLSDESKLRVIAEVELGNVADQHLLILTNQLKAFRSYLKIFYDYRLTNYDGNATYVRVLDSYCYVANQALRSAISEGCSVITIPSGGHLQVLHPPGVSTVARLVLRVLNVN